MLAPHTSGRTTVRATPPHRTAHLRRPRRYIPPVYPPPPHTEPIPRTMAPALCCRSAPVPPGRPLGRSWRCMDDSPSIALWAAEPQRGYLAAGAGTVPHSGHLASAPCEAVAVVAARGGTDAGAGGGPAPEDARRESRNREERPQRQEPAANAPAARGHVLVPKVVGRVVQATERKAPGRDRILIAIENDRATGKTDRRPPVAADPGSIEPAAADGEHPDRARRQRA